MPVPLYPLLSTRGRRALAGSAVLLCGKAVKPDAARDRTVEGTETAHLVRHPLRLRRVPLRGGHGNGASTKSHQLRGTALTKIEVTSG